MTYEEEIEHLKKEIEDWRGRLATQCGKTLAAQSIEREKVAKVMIGLGIATGHGDTIEDLLKEWATEYTRIKDLTKGVKL